MTTTCSRHNRGEKKIRFRRPVSTMIDKEQRFQERSIESTVRDDYSFGAPEERVATEKMKERGTLIKMN